MRRYFAFGNVFVYKFERGENLSAHLFRISPGRYFHSYSLILYFMSYTFNMCTCIREGAINQ